MKLGEIILPPEKREAKFSGGFPWMVELRKDYYLYAYPFQVKGKTYAYIEGEEEGKEVHTIIDPERYSNQQEIIEAVKSLLRAVGFPTKEELRREELTNHKVKGGNG